MPDRLADLMCRQWGRRGLEHPDDSIDVGHARILPLRSTHPVGWSDGRRQVSVLDGPKCDTEPGRARGAAPGGWMRD